jgi:hypothetical protein
MPTLLSGLDPREKVQKEIVDAWVEEWRRMNLSKPSESSIIADITSATRCRKMDCGRFVVNITLRDHRARAAGGRRAIKGAIFSNIW